MRLILKHLRQRGQIPFYNALLTQTNLQIEHPLITSLYNNVVLAGDFVESEKVLAMAASTGLLQNFIMSASPKPIWTRIRDTAPDGEMPSRRGGHQMAIDPDRGVIYLLGGWDGKRSLADFWSYSIPDASWKLICRNTGDEGGPGARNCHKIVFDRATGYIYVLGGFHNGASASKIPRSYSLLTYRFYRGITGTASSTSGGDATNVSLNSDFYRYATRGPFEGRWESLCNDTGNKVLTNF